MPEKENMSFVEDWLAARPVEEAPRPGRIVLGTCVDDWRVEAYLGAGRSAEVYRVVNVRTGREGALKILVDGTCGLKERFAAEMDALRFLNLKALPKFYGNGVYGGRPFYVMEYLQPLLLPLPRGEEADFIVGVAKAVGALHKRGYVHRDLKPANVLRRLDGTPVLIDLGLVKKVGEDGSAGCRPSQLSLVDGRPVGVGTLDYAAPEQLLKGEASVRGDVFSLGKILRTCFEGEPPRSWRRIIRRATQADPDDRYATAAAFVTAVRHRGLVGKVSVGFVVGMVAAFAAASFLVPSKPPPSPVGPAPGPSVSPPPLETVVVLLAQKDGESAEAYFARLLPFAEKDNVEAQVKVAEAYFHGRGTKKDRVAAVQWYTRAAALGNPNAQASLALCRLHGFGCERDDRLAFDLFTKAAAAGNLPAMADLAYCYLNGRGVEKNVHKGFEKALKAAERGHAAAQVMVAECYLMGYGTEVDRERAKVWLQSAANQGNKRAREILVGL